MLRVVCLVAVSGVLALAGLARAEPVDRAELLLGAIDVLLTPQNMAAVGLTPERLQRVAEDPTARRYLRVRAVGGLGVLGQARSVVSTLAAGDADVEVRIQAVLSLARGFGRADREGVLRELRRLRTAASAAVGGIIDAELRRLEAPPPSVSLEAER